MFLCDNRFEVYSILEIFLGLRWVDNIFGAGKVSNIFEAGMDKQHF